MTEAPSRNARPLGDIRVLEVGGPMAVGYAGRLLCDLGADVAKLESAVGDPLRAREPFLHGQSGSDRSAAAAYVHQGKRSVCVEPSSIDGASALEGLIDAADVVLCDLDAGDGWFGAGAIERARARRQSLIVVDISTFGNSGPLAGTAGGDLIATALSGMLSIVSSGASDPDPLPLRMPGELTSMFAGCNAALAALGALVWRDRTDSGCRIDVSVLESISSTLATAYSAVTYAGVVPVHDGVRGVVPWGIYQCADGEVLVQCTEDSQWRSLVKLLGDPEWGELEMFETTALRIEQSEAVESLVSAAMLEQSVGPFLEAAQRAGVAASLVNSAADVVGWEHLRSRGFLRPISLPGGGEILAPTPPYRYDGEHAFGERRLASIGEQTQGVLNDWTPRPTVATSTSPPPGELVRPLAGCRVLDLTWVWAGPFAAMQLAHLGADVIKVESASRLDVTRVLGPWADQVSGRDRSGYFNQYNQGKRGVCVDLSGEQGRALLARLIPECDVVVDNMRCGALARMGFTQERLLQLNPRLVAVSLTGFGESGPERERQAYGSIIDAVSGMNSIMGRPGEGPTEVPMSLPDPGSGLHAAVAMVAAIRRARLTGRGCRVECSMVESWISTMPWSVLRYSALGENPRATGNRDDQQAPHGVFPCAGDYSWVALVAEGAEQFARLARAIGRDDLADDPGLATLAGRRAREDELERAIGSWTCDRSQSDVVEAMQHAGVTCAPVRAMDAVVACGHLRDRGWVVELDHPVVGRRALPGIPWQAPAWARTPLRAAPVMGQHTTEVLVELLGLDEAELRILSEDGVLR